MKNKSIAWLKRKSNWSALASRGLVFSLIWWVLTDGVASAWWLGVPAVVAALVISLVLVAPIHFNWLEVVRFVPVFVARSLLGAVDVARRAFDPQLPLAPEVIHYSLQLPPGFSQLAMANTVSLLPGTLSTRLEANQLSVHVLDAQGGYRAELELLEQHVGRMFGVRLTVVNQDE